MENAVYAFFIINSRKPKYYIKITLSYHLDLVRKKKKD